MGTTAELLLTTLRQVTGVDELAYAVEPVALSGGYWAELVAFRLADPPPVLAGDLVARIVPDAGAGAWEATIQRYVADHGFATPAVRLTAPASSPLGRFLLVMDRVDGSPPMSGLSAGATVRQMPGLLRHLPGRLADIAAALHALDPGPLAEELEALGTTIPTTTAGFVSRQVEGAAACGRHDLVAAGERLLATEPASDRLVVAHGDLHPFNLLVGPGGTALVDWTVARVAHPAFTVGFTHLVLADPPVAVPAAVAPGLRSVGRNLARRFVTAYRHRTDGTRAAVRDAELAWHRRVHALRILVELASWQAAGTPPPAGHPWLVLDPVVRRELALPAGGPP